MVCPMDFIAPVQLLSYDLLELSNGCPMEVNEHFPNDFHYGIIMAVQWHMYFLWIYHGFRVIGI